MRSSRLSEIAPSRSRVLVFMVALVAALLLPGMEANAADVVIHDFESGLPTGVDGDGVPIGFYTFGDAGSDIEILTRSTPPGPVLEAVGEPNSVLEVELSSEPFWGSFAGLIHAFENPAADTWVSQDWSAAEGIALWFYGQATGTSLFLDILDNRNPGSTTDDAERYTMAFVDDFEGWQLLEFPFHSFVRKEIGNSAPNDGLGLTDVWGWTLGALATGGSEILYWVDEVALYGTAGPPEDTEAPMWVVPAEITASTDPDAATAVVPYTATVTDNVGVVSSSCSPASGAAFAVGTTTVSCAAADAQGNVGTATFDVTVSDTQAPQWTVPADITVIAAGIDGTTVNYTATVADNVAVVSSTCTPASGATFPLGVTTVECTAADAAGNTATAFFDVTIEVDDGSVETLVDEIEDLELPRGIERSLQAPLKGITRLLEDGNPNNDQAACNKLDEFANKVANRFDDGSLTDAEADALTAFARALQLEYGCP